MTVTLEVLSIILAVVALVVTVIGFIASLYFYRHGVELQKAADSALAAMNARTEGLETQVSGVLGRTIDHLAASKSHLLAGVDDLPKQLEQAQQAIVEQSRMEIGLAGRKEEERLAQIVNSQIHEVIERINSTVRTAEATASGRGRPSKADAWLERGILEQLDLSSDWLTTTDLASALGVAPGHIQKAMSSLRGRGYVATQPTLFDLPGETPAGSHMHGLTTKGRESLWRVASQDSMVI